MVLPSSDPGMQGGRIKCPGSLNWILCGALSESFFSFTGSLNGGIPQVWGPPWAFWLWHCRAKRGTTTVLNVRSINWNMKGSVTVCVSVCVGVRVCTWIQSLSWKYKIMWFLVSMVSIVKVIHFVSYINGEINALEST